MTNQAPPVTDAVQDYTVEKAILSGTAFQSSILGPGAYRITNNAPPVFYTNPVITGRVVPSSVLTCDEGSFNSSPRASVSYQWKRDTMDITDEIGVTYTSVLSDIDTIITCEVTINNSTGSDTALSNELLMEAITPGWVYEFDANFITGLNSPGRLDLNVAATCIISGFAHDMKCDVNLGTVLAVTGFYHDFKCDVNTAEINIITGIVGLMQLDVSEMEADIITGLQSNFADVNECDAYVLQTFEDMGALALLNGDASGAGMDDWTMDIGGVTMVTSAAGWSFDTNRTGPVFKGDNRGLGLDSQMSQVVVLDAGILTDVDLGRIHAATSYSFYAARHYDGVQITLTALNAADGVLNTVTGPLRLYANVGASNSFGWIERLSDIPPLSLPTLTRKIKVTILFEMNDTTGGTDNNGYIDNIVVDLLKLE